MTRKFLVPIDLPADPASATQAANKNYVDNGLAGKVATTRQVLAGTGLTGGGDLTADRTLTVAYGTTSTTACVGNDTRLSVKPYPPVTLTYAATITINAAQGTHFRVTATGNPTFAAPTNPTDGQVIVIEFLASGASYTATLTTGATGAFAFGTDITALTATASGKTDYIQAVYNASAARWRAIGYVKGF